MWPSYPRRISAMTTRSCRYLCQDYFPLMRLLTPKQRSAKDNVTQDQPLRMKSTPMKRPMIRYPEAGHRRQTKIPRTRVTIPFKRTQPHWGKRIDIDAMMRNAPDMRKKMVTRRVTVRGLAPGLATSMKPTTKEDAGKARPICTLKPIAT